MKVYAILSDWNYRGECSHELECIHADIDKARLKMKEIFDSEIKDEFGCLHGRINENYEFIEDLSKVSAPYEDNDITIEDNSMSINSDYYELYFTVCIVEHELK